MNHDNTRTVWLDGIGAGTIVTAECWPTPNGFYEPIVTREQAQELCAAIEAGYDGADIRITFTWEGDDLLVWNDDVPDYQPEVIDRIQPDENGMYQIVGFTFDIYDGPTDPCPWCSGIGCQSCGWTGRYEESDDVTHPDDEPTGEVALRVDKAYTTGALMQFALCSDDYCTEGAQVMVVVPVSADCHIGMRQFNAYLPMCGTCHTHWQYAVSGDVEVSA